MKKKNTNTITFVAFHCAQQIDIPRFRKDFSAPVIYGTSRELFYSLNNHGYVHLFHFGVVVVAGLTEPEVTQLLNLLSDYCVAMLDEKLREDLDVHHSPESSMRFGFDDVSVPELDENAVRVVMRIMARSVAIRYYSKETEQLLQTLGGMAEELEETSRLKMGRRRIFQFIGKALNTRNRITESIYVFDIPSMIWENESLDRLDSGLIDFFDLPFRQKGVTTRLAAIEDHIQVFSDLYHYRESSRLEWIIIILIAIEVVDMLIKRLV